MSQQGLFGFLAKKPLFKSPVAQSLKRNEGSAETNVTMSFQNIQPQPETPESKTPVLGGNIARVAMETEEVRQGVREQLKQSNQMPVFTRERATAAIRAQAEDKVHKPKASNHGR